MNTNRRYEFSWDLISDINAGLNLSVTTRLELIG